MAEMRLKKCEFYIELFGTCLRYLGKASVWTVLGDEKSRDFRNKNQANG
ncbi:hypothetical protein [Paenibacillus xylanilyticus]